MAGSFRLGQDQEVRRCSRSEQRIEIGDASARIKSVDTQGPERTRARACQTVERCSSRSTFVAGCHRIFKINEQNICTYLSCLAKRSGRVAGVNSQLRVRIGTCSFITCLLEVFSRFSKWVSALDCRI
jgi:hypothetical protein